MSVFADQKRGNLRQVSADGFALTKKRLEEDLPTAAPVATEGGAPAEPKQVKEEAEQRAETQMHEETAQKGKK